MKQKVVISVQMEDAKRRSKAMKIVVGVTGVLSAAIEGADKNQIVVVGEDVDPATLATSLKKKMGSALLVSVLPVQDKKEEKKEEKKQEKQKVVIKLQMDDAKRRSKAMKIVVGVTGVLSAAIEGADKNQIVVVGEDVDPVKLTTSLKKKMGFAKLVSVLPVQDKKEEEKKQEKKPEKKQEKKEEKEKKPEKKQEKKPEKKQEKEKKPEKKQEKKPDSAEQPVAPWPYGWGWLPPKYF